MGTCIGSSLSPEVHVFVTHDHNHRTWSFVRRHRSERLEGLGYLMFAQVGLRLLDLRLHALLKGTAAYDECFPSEALMTL